MKGSGDYHSTAGNTNHTIMSADFKGKHITDTKYFYKYTHQAERRLSAFVSCVAREGAGHTKTSLVRGQPHHSNQRCLSSHEPTSGTNCSMRIGNLLLFKLLCRSLHSVFRWPLITAAIVIHYVPGRSKNESKRPD